MLKAVLYKVYIVSPFTVLVGQFQRCSYSRNFVIRSLLLSDVFHKSLFFSQYVTLLHNVGLMQLLMRCFSVCSSL